MKSGSQAPKKHKNKPTTARLLAAKTLLPWFKGKALVISDKSSFSLTSEYTLYKYLVSSVVRFKAKLEFYIEELAKRPLSKLDAEVVICLMLGLIQLDEDSKIEQHAALFETVELLKKLHKPHLKGFVNANLRQYLRTREKLNVKLAQQALVTRSSHADFMVNRWQQQYGDQLTEEVCRSNNILPDIQIVLSPKFSIKEVVPSLEEQGYLLTDLHKNGFCVKNPAGLFETSWAQKGAFLVQDRSFQVISHLVSRLPKTSVLDACASPGGKLVHLDWVYPDEIELLVGAELSPYRMHRLKENCDRLKCRAELLCMDATKPALRKEFDLIVVDAPCSGTGTIRKHPEIKWNRTVQDFQNNGKRQLEILEAMAPLVRVGGHLLYVTCSLEIEENQKVAENFMHQHPDDFVQVPFDERLLPENAIKSSGCYQVLPSEKSMGGFAILFKKQETGMSAVLIS